MIRSVIRTAVSLSLIGVPSFVAWLTEIRLYGTEAPPRCTHGYYSSAFGTLWGSSMFGITYGAWITVLLLLAAVTIKMTFISWQKPVASIALFLSCLAIGIWLTGSFEGCFGGGRVLD